MPPRQTADAIESSPVLPKDERRATNVFAHVYALPPNHI